jgi:hypothetical protein
MALNFNTNPYYDDFDEDKNFHRILFRPGRAVQARELTQSQTILQNQIDRFGKHVFQEGSKVTGAETFDEQVYSVKLQSTYAGTAISISGYDNYFAVANSSNAVYKIKKALVADDTDPNTLLLTFIKTSSISTLNSNGSIANSETLRIYSTDDLATANLVTRANVSATESSTIARVFSVTEGVFFINGNFVQSNPETVVVSKYSNDANVTVGFDVEESIVTSSSDTSLLDPAVGASNYIAPGADRYKITLTLTTKEISANESIPSLTSSKYIEVARYRRGQLVKNVQNSQYSVLADTLARRTYDESGDYRVEGLDPKIPDEKFADAANTNFVLDISPGKAYVRGYEIETVGVTELVLSKSRDTETVSGYDVPAYYGNYFYVTSANGEIFNFSTASKLEIHSNNGNFGASTKIAEAYPRNIEYVSGNGSASVYKLQLFNIVKTSNTPIDLANTIIAGNTTSVNGTCNIDSSSITTRTLTGAYNSANPLINLSSSTGVTVGMAVSNPNAAEIRFPTYVTAVNGNQITISQTPVASNGAATLSFKSAYLTDTNYDSSVFESSYDVVKEFSQVNYYTKRVFKSVSFTAGVGSVQTNDGTERFASATGGNKQENYAICIRTPASAYSRGQWVDLSSNTYFSLPSPSVGSPATLNINLADTGFNGTADILTTIDITAAARRTKTLVTGVRKYINQYTANTLSLGFADVVNVSAIYISDSTTNSANANANVNVVGSFTIDYGQRDGFYDHATIKVNNNATVNSGNVLIIFDRYSHSGTGFFDTLSYPTYNTIPTYTKTDGTVIDLRDSVDFRPIRVSDASSNVYSNLAMSFSSQQIVDSILGAVDTNVEYYLSRTDKVVLRKNGTFKVISGVSALNNPPTPNDEVDAMTLYTLKVDPYTYSTSNVDITIQNNRRYTMRDIGALDNRLTRVEYYTALNLLEKDIATTTYYDDQDNRLFNNGFIVDSFKGHGVGDVFSPDYKCSIDYDNEVLRPKFESNATFLSVSSNTLAVTGNLLTLSYTSVPYITQNVASGIINVNPFNVVGFIGYVKLDKESPRWIDFKKAKVVLNKDKDLDNYVYSNNFEGTKWNDWALLGFSEENNIVYTYYSTSGQQIQTTSSGLVRENDSRLNDNRVLLYVANTTINFELFGMRPNTELTVYLDSVHLGSYLNTYNTVSNTYTTEALVSNANGYAKGQLKIPNDDTFKFTFGENHLYFCDNRLGMQLASTLAETYFYSGKKKKKKKKKKPNVPFLTVIGGESTGPYIDSNAPTYTTGVSVAITAASSGGGRYGGSTDYQKAVNDLTGSSSYTPPSYATVVSNANAAADKIVQLYQSELGRKPDQDGYNYWVSVAAGGASLDKVTEAFKNEAKKEKCSVGDPLGQTFFVNEFTNPEGIYVSSIDLFFATKDTTGIPVTVELRPTVNGFPDSNYVIPGSTVTLNPTSVNLPVTANVPVATTFTFSSPIFLEPGEYSFVVAANSDKYNVYIGTILKQRIDGTGPIVSQPYIGSFFKSQNGSTWTPDQNSDICFVLNKCEFNANTTQVAVLTTEQFGYEQQYDAARLTIPYDSVATSANISFELATKNNGAAVLSDYVGIIPNSNIILDQRKVANTAADANVKISMFTTNPDVSPYVDVSTSTYVAIKNLLESPAAANVTSYPETLSSGGGAASKYLLRKVTLNDAFDATALRVYLQQNLPQGSSIQVYYRAVAATDSDKIENKPWVLMTQSGVSSVNQNASEYYDYEYKVNNVTYTSSGVTYTNFRTFAIKIVFFSTNPAAAPTVKNLRAIALS